MRRRGLGLAKLQITNYKLQIHQRGYMLITLMLALALITIALLTVLPEIGQQIRRASRSWKIPTTFVSFASAIRIQSIGTQPRATRRTSNFFIRPTSA